MKRRSTLVGLLVSGVLFLAGCGGLDYSEKDDCQANDDCLTGYFCNQEGKCQKGCTAGSLRCVDNSVQRCMIDHWEDWEDCAESEECLLSQGRAMCVEEGCDPDCVEKECGSNGCGGHCGICSGDEECSPSGQCSKEKECETTEDCPDGYWCDGMVWECKKIECIPNCTGKCCGDDGCDGTCPDTCPSGYTCNQDTCQCEST